jgi:hypothetical protein
MEFEENKPVNDTDRRLAEAKKLTLQPIHADVTPDIPSDAELGTHHLNEPIIANISNDTEINATLLQPTRSFLGTQQRLVKTPPHKLIISLVVAAATLVGLVMIATL